MGSYWRIQFFGEFRLTSPAGENVRLPTRHCEALLAALALNRDSGLYRYELGEALWPEAAEERQRANLRQTLSLVRKALGSNCLETSRTHSKLAGSFACETDIEMPALRTEPIFLRSFEGGWAEEVRRRFLGEEQKEIPAFSPTEHFYEFVRFLAETNPARVIGALRENLTLTRALSSEQLRRLLAGLREPQSSGGWTTYLSGCVSDTRRSVQFVRAQFLTSLETALAEEDRELAVQSCASLAVGYLWNKDLGNAKRYGLLGLQLARRSRNRDLEGTANKIMFVLSIHSGETQAAVEFCSRARQAFSSSTDGYALESLNYYYLSALGRLPADGPDFIAMKRFGNESGHRSIQWHTRAGHANEVMRDSHPVDALPALTESCREAEGIQNGLFTVFAYEALGRGYAKARLKAEAVDILAKTRRLKASMGMTFSIWDRSNLS